MSQYRISSGKARVIRVEKIKASESLSRLSFTVAHYVFQHPVLRNRRSDSRYYAGNQVTVTVICFYISYTQPG